MTIRWIRKVGAAIVDGDRLLVVRKRGVDAYILPGGKPEGDETELETLAREIAEELGCGIADAVLTGTFKDVAAGTEQAVVVVSLYAARLVGEPRPQSEIEELMWIPVRGRSPVPLAPSIINGILPHLRQRRKTRPSEQQVLQGVFELVK